MGRPTQSRKPVATFEQMLLEFSNESLPRLKKVIASKGEKVYPFYFARNGDGSKCALLVTKAGVDARALGKKVEAELSGVKWATGTLEFHTQKLHAVLSAGSCAADLVAKTWKAAYKDEARLSEGQIAFRHIQSALVRAAVVTPAERDELLARARKPETTASGPETPTRDPSSPPSIPTAAKREDPRPAIESLDDEAAIQEVHRIRDTLKRRPDHGAAVADLVAVADNNSRNIAVVQAVLAELRTAVDAEEVRTSEWVADFGEDALADVPLAEVVPLKYRALRDAAKVLLASLESDPGAVLRAALGSAEAKAADGGFLEAGAELEAAMETAMPRSTWDLDAAAAIALREEEERRRVARLRADLAAYQRLLRRRSHDVQDTTVPGSSPRVTVGALLRSLPKTDAGIPLPELRRTLEGAVALLARVVKDEDREKQAWLGDYGVSKDWDDPDAVDTANDLVDGVVKAKCQELERRVGAAFSAAPPSVQARLAGRLKGARALRKGGKDLEAGRLFDDLSALLEAERERFILTVTDEVGAVEDELRRIAEAKAAQGDRLGGAQRDIGELMTGLQVAVEDGVRKQKAMVEAAESFWTWRSTTRERARDLEEARITVGGIQKAAESIYRDVLGWLSTFETVPVDAAALQGRIDVLGGEVALTTWLLDGDGPGIVDRVAAAAGVLEGEDGVASVRKLGSDIDEFETFLRGFIGSIVEVDQGATEAMARVFGRDVSVESGGVRVKLSAVEIEEICGKEAAKDAAKVAELDTLANLLLPKVASLVRDETGLDARDVLKLPAADLDELRAKVTALATEILQANARNKTDRRVTNTLQGIRATLATLSTVSAGVRLAVTFCADPTAYVQAAMALKNLVGVVLEARKSLEDREKALREALKDLAAKPGAKDLAAFVKKLRDAATTADATKILSATQAAMGLAAGGLPKAQEGRRLHGSKTAVLFGSWHEAKTGIEELLAMVREIASGAEELRLLLGTEDSIEVGGKTVTRARLTELQAKIPEHEQKLAAAFDEIVTIGGRYEHAIEVQMEAAREIARAGALQRGASRLADLGAAVESGIEAGQDVTTIFAEGSAAIAAMGTEDFFSICGGNAFALGSSALSTASDAVAGLLSDLVSLGL